MIWAAIFAISVAQGIFLLILLKQRSSKNRLATSLIMIITMVMVVTNFDYLITSTPLYEIIPRLFGISFGMMFLMGPTLYFYSQTVTNSGFKWKNKYLLHFIPYTLNLLLNIPLFLVDRKNKLFLINSFLSGTLHFRLADIILIAIQNIHLFIYLSLSIKWMKKVRLSYGNVPYMIEMKSRLTWLRTLVICFSVFLLVVLCLFISILIDRIYIPAANNCYTVITSGIIYFIAYKLVLNPELISPDFDKKYKAVKQLKNLNEDDFVVSLKKLMEVDQIYTNPELKLATLAKDVNLTSHQLSRLINEKFSKSFNDLVNEYRVGEFINRINDPKYEAYSVYGIAMDVGFNSKSSFNSTFKKLTGKTPSEFKSL